MEQPDLDECGIEVKQELEEDPLAGQLDTTLWTYEALPIYLLVILSLIIFIRKTKTFGLFKLVSRHKMLLNI